MSSLVLTLILLGIFPGSSVSGSYSDYTDAVVYSLTTPFRQLVEFLTDVWNFFVNIVCRPFFMLFDVTKALLTAIENGILILIERVISMFDFLLFRPVTFLVKCFNQLTDYGIRYPLTYVTSCIISAVVMGLEKARIISESTKFVDIFTRILAFLIHAVVDLLQTIVFLVVEMPSNIIFHGVIESLLAIGLKNVVSGCRLVLCSCVEVLTLPFTVLNYLLKAVISLPLYAVLNTLSFISFCVLDPLIYFIYLVLTVTKLSVLLFVLTVFTVYVYNYNAPGQAGGLWAATYRVTNKLTQIARKLLVANQMEEEILDEVDKCCAICFEERLLARLIPCNHENTCVECLNQILRLSGKCPICRASIQKIEI